jgi:protein pelota
MSYSGRPNSSRRSTTTPLTHRHRASDPQVRKKYVALVEAVQQKGGEVLRFSSMHESGQRKFISLPILRTAIDVFRELNQLTGIAAILTFPLDVEVVEMEEREAKEEAAGETEERIDDSVMPAGT